MIDDETRAIAHAERRESAYKIACALGMAPASAIVFVNAVMATTGDWLVVTDAQITEAAKSWIHFEQYRARK